MRKQTTTTDSIYGAEVRKPGPGERRIGILFEGPKGWIYVTRGRIEASDKALLDEPLAANAERLYVSESTAKAHVARIFEKVGAANRAQALMAALRLGLLDDTPLNGQVF